MLYYCYLFRTFEIVIDDVQVESQIVAVAAKEPVARVNISPEKKKPSREAKNVENDSKVVGKKSSSKNKRFLIILMSSYINWIWFFWCVLNFFVLFSSEKGEAEKGKTEKGYPQKGCPQKKDPRKKEAEEECSGHWKRVQQCHIFVQKEKVIDVKFLKFLIQAN